jgi:hypothetical protein
MAAPETGRLGDEETWRGGGWGAGRSGEGHAGIPGVAGRARLGILMSTR